MIWYVTKTEISSRNAGISSGRLNMIEFHRIGYGDYWTSTIGYRTSGQMRGKRIRTIDSRVCNSRNISTSWGGVDFRTIWNIPIGIFTSERMMKMRKGEGTMCVVKTWFRVLCAGVEDIDFAHVFVRLNPNWLVSLREDDHYVPVTNNHLVMPIFVRISPANDHQINFFAFPSSYSKFSIRSSTIVSFIITECQKREISRKHIHGFSLTCWSFVSDHQYHDVRESVELVDLLVYQRPSVSVLCLVLNQHVQDIRVDRMILIDVVILWTIQSNLSWRIPWKNNREILLFDLHTNFQSKPSFQIFVFLDISPDVQQWSVHSHRSHL